MSKNAYERNRIYGKKKCGEECDSAIIFIDEIDSIALETRQDDIGEVERRSCRSSNSRGR
jgi:SpoVK/Ycf46/Vps4 family AAA+-type ATPase